MLQELFQRRGLVGWRDEKVIGISLVEEMILEAGGRLLDRV